MTTGIVSKLGVDPLIYSPEGVSTTVPNAIVTDVEIAPGSSGGPLLHMQGQDIGMVMNGRVAHMQLLRT